MFADQIEGTAFCIANAEYPTRITANYRSSPDVTIIGTQHLSAYTSWSSHIALNSDRLPIIIKVDKSSDFILSEERTFINFKKTDWTRLRDLCEAQFSQRPSLENIPREASRLAKRRDALRRLDPADPRLKAMDMQIGAPTIIN